MRAELVAVGSELLLGQGVDTNSAWIAGRLAEVGVDVHRHTTVGDNLDRLSSCLVEALARADVVILTGGLGPTQDDLTRHAVAAVAGVGLRRDPTLVRFLEEYFAERGRDMPGRNLVQADLPEGATALAPQGTAAGFRLPVGDRVVYAVPGVPREMRAMIAGEVIPDLQEREGRSVVVSRVVRTTGMGESAVAEDVGDVVARLDEEAARAADDPAAAPVPTIAFLASRGETVVRITVKAAARPAALGALAPVVDEVVGLLGLGVAGLDEEGAEFAVARLLLARGWTLGLAESITAGGVGARLARVPGASAWFRGGLITYASDAKASLAGVSEALLAAEGPVSEPVAAALADGARRRLGADTGLAVVGVAGPELQGGAEVGTVRLGLALPDEPGRARTVRLPLLGLASDDAAGATAVRTEIQQWAVATAIDHLRRALAGPG